MTSIISSDKPRDTDSGDLLIWILAGSELVAFGALLTAFVIASVLHPEIFAAGKARLPHVLPVINTVVLLTSGWFAAKAAEQKAIPRRRLMLLVAALGGLVFVGLKCSEYVFEGSSLLAGDPFSQLYLLITGFHLMHVAFGSIILVLVAVFPTSENVHLITTLWHVIDIVWLVMFPVVYLL
ncbi:nitric oxide reductase NorE protein [Rhizobium sp. BK529]|uniref:cytochrome c oxidase subunit 3 n=1 Tax=unclassified Rhizobium TaxID=2613769 RepID=UPI0010539091|nr:MULTISPECIES: cytochrome c oxidase subunit 3 [unclassified Rhizobium]MBB3593748.1 nitric oxide reductase NorE protein [Rhizobium sp. BK529]TCR96034.1 nitric oxide reductase NorE protein [Rhizobium sp. BK418]